MQQVGLLWILTSPRLKAGLTRPTQVLNDVLDLQRMDAGRFEITPRPFNLNSTLTSMLGGVRVAAEAKGLKLDVELDANVDKLQPDPNGEGLIVVGDPIRLGQVLTNLTSNAIKFSAAAGEIRVVTRLIPTVLPGVHSAPTSPAEDPKPRRSQFERLESTDGGTATAVNTHERSPRPRASDYVTFRVEVHDSGPGVRPSDLAGSRLFRPFRQTRVGRASGEGSGLGLAIVRQIINLSDGRLGIFSKKGQGAQFWFELTYRVACPREIMEAQATATPGPAPAPPPSIQIPLVHKEALLGRTVSIEVPPLPPSAPSAPLVDDSNEIAEEPLRCLVVDDDPLTRMLFQRMLMRSGVVTVDTATNGKECVDLLLGKPPDIPVKLYDVVFLDNQMPLMTGEEAVRTLREAGRDDYVVGCTGNALTEDQLSYLRAGANQIIPKPILLGQISQALANARERKASRNAVQGPS
ncbi:hypothetical protein P7C70_g6934, partial [Phenoliferia sp. Uapishka_3]